MVKYADDTYLVVPEVNSASCEDELKHIDQWATDNNLRLNQAKTVEIVFYARGRHRAEEELPSPSPPGSQRASSIKVLGVTISNNLSMAGHVSALWTPVQEHCTVCGFSEPTVFTKTVWTKFSAVRTVLAKLLYASPAWSGFCSAADNGKLDRFLNRCRKLYRCQLLNQDISELI